MKRTVLLQKIKANIHHWKNKKLPILWHTLNFIFQYSVQSLEIFVKSKLLLAARSVEVNWVLISTGTVLRFSSNELTLLSKTESWRFSVKLNSSTNKECFDGKISWNGSLQINFFRNFPFYHFQIFRQINSLVLL